MSFLKKKLKVLCFTNNTTIKEYNFFHHPTKGELSLIICLMRGKPVMIELMRLCLDTKGDVS